MFSTFLECSQCNTRIRLLYLLYDIDFTRAKQYNTLFSMFCLPNEEA